MSQGSCVCGDVKYTINGDMGPSILCHCMDCRKISGSTHSLNFLIGDDDFKVNGKPKEWAKKADSGQEITSYFCGNCGSTLYRRSGTFPGKNIVKGGTLLEGHDQHKPAVELYSAERVSWQAAIPGADQKTEMS